SHPVLPDLSVFHAWLREAGAAIAKDEGALAALGAAAVIASQRGTLRPARELVLDPSLPDLALDWGLAPDVPHDVARWLRASFALDRRTRRTIVRGRRSSSPSSRAHSRLPTRRRPSSKSACGARRCARA